MTPDSELLSRYARTHSEDAFAELVRRHVNLVYSAARRQVNDDAYLAQDVAQTVFTDLARKASSLSRRATLTGWLYTSAHFAAAKMARTENRRRDREEKFMREPIHEPAPDPGFAGAKADWEKLRPALDQAMHELKETDREAVLLRFFENRPFAEIGEKIGLSENAARMRVERALEKLRAAFLQRGVATTATLASVISANAVQIAPAGLAATLASTSLAGAGTGTTFTLLKLMTATKLTLGIGALVIAGATTALVVQHQAQIKLREENQALRQQITRLQSDNASLSKREALAKPTPRLPAPPLPVAIQPKAPLTEDLQFTNIYDRFKDKAPKLTAAQVEAFLKANRTNATSLLAAYRTSGDPALLKEAMEKYPNDPQVAFEAVLDKDLSPEQQRQWLDTFEKSAPDNALANYLSAFNYFNSGQTDQGIQELAAASGKQPDDYTLARAQDDEEAYLSAGYSAAEAERISDGWLMIPQLSQVKKLGVDLVDLAKAYNQSGDQASAQAAFQMAINLGQRYANPSNDPMLIHQLVGMAIEKIALSAMDPNSSYGNNGQTVQDQLNQITQNRTAVKELVQQAEPLLPTMSDQDILNYENRRRAFGEVAALQWVVSKYGQK
ncbi:MAG: sigma-70 family RNA polymerase sigma factor [Verrucomicrobiota bacterium]